MDLIFTGIFSLMIFIGAIMGIIAFVKTQKLEQKLSAIDRKIAQLQMAQTSLRHQLIAQNNEAQNSQPQTATQAPPAHTHADPAQTSTDTPGAADIPVTPAPAPAPATPPAEPPQPAVEAARASTPAQKSQPARSPAAKAKGIGLEERLGTRWAVWVGGVTLVLGGIFLVHYSIEAGLISPLVRILLAALFATVLFAAGEYLRRKPGLIPTKAANTATDTNGEKPDEKVGDKVGGAAGYIPGVLTLAGTTTAFATIFSAHMLYDMIGPATTFVLLALVALGTLALALLQGPLVASTGLLASYIVPFMVQSSDPAPWVLVFYGLIITGGSYGIARLRGWHWFAMATAIAGFLWGHVVALAAPYYMGTSLAFYDIAILGAAIAAFAVGIHPRDPARVAPAIDWKSALLIAVNGWLVIYLLPHSGHDATFTVTMMIVLALLLATAAFFPALAPVALAAPFVAIIGYLGWDIPLSIDPLLFDQPIITDAIDKFSVLPNLQSFLLTGIGFGLLLALGGFAGALFSTARLYMAIAGVSGPIGLFLIALWRSETLDVDPFFGFFALAMAAGFLGALAMIDRKMPVSAHGRDGVLATYCVGTIGMIATAMFILLGDGWLPLGLAALAVATIWVGGRWPLPGLAKTALGLGVLVLITIFWQPTIVPADQLGTTPVFNALLWGYGGPALAFWACVWKLHRLAGPRPQVGHDAQDSDGDNNAKRAENHASQNSTVGASIFAKGVFERLAFEGLAIFTTLAAGAVILHHATNQGQFYALPDSLMEWSLQALLALAAAIGLQRVGRALHSPLMANCILGLGYLGFFMLALLNLVLLNPLLTNEFVGNGLVFNLLLSAYALPAILTGLLATRFSAGKPEQYRLLAGILSILLAFSAITLEIRHLFHNGYIGMYLPWTSPELYSYSAAWLVFGIALLAFGVWRQSQHLRLASAAFVLLAIAKAFLFDMSGLEGIWRALSFIGLGIVLMGIGLFYQRVLARQNNNSAKAKDESAENPENGENAENTENTENAQKVENAENTENVKNVDGSSNNTAAPNDGSAPKTPDQD
ncbi:DUF2339 domain-containing protein [Thalassospira lucentensis]|uniref:DUF2339 domain-containing protein n=1 Tax=Thalassospira lucentensis TaxID=168935 RepID=UPI00142D768E|nr:DUF2339 domain-containing protein [Thalassospira lucentensis]NIZ03225.1 DUF2339 domain-containing protein [Thalassospira lucentensis]